MILSMRGLIFSFDLQEKITNLADILLFVVNLPNLAGGTSRYFSELFIGSNIGELLKLSDFFALSNVQFFDGSLFNLLSEVRKIELEYSESISHKVRQLS